MSSPSGPSVRPQRIAPSGVDDALRDHSGPLRVGAALAGIGAIAVAVAPALGVTSGAGHGSVPGGVVAAVCALLVPIVAVAASFARRVAFGGAILASAGAVGLGLTVMDLQLLTDTIDANRLELFRPLSAATLEPGVGAYVVVAGHVLGAVAGIGGLVAVSRAALRDGYGGEAGTSEGRGAAGRIGAVVAVLAAVILAGALFAPAFTSDDPVFLVDTVVQGPTAIAVGSAMVAVAVLVAVVAGLSSVSVATATGAVVGTAIAALGLVGTRAVSAATTGDRISAGVGSTVGASAAVVLSAVGLALPVLARRGVPEAPSAPADEAAPTRKMGKSARARVAAEAAAAVRRKSARWHAIAGTAGITAGVVLAAGAFLPLLRVRDGLTDPTILGARIAIFGAIVLVLFSVALLFSELAAPVRPVVGVYWVAAVMCSTPVLQALVLALSVPGVRMGTGAYLLILGVLIAMVTGVLLWVAGSAEREEVDTSIDPEPSTVTSSLGGLGALLAVAGLGTPLYRSAESTPATWAEFPWGWDAWGQALFAVAVVVAVVVARRSRPVRGGALLIGAGVGTAVYVAGWPLIEVRGGAAGPGVGALLGAVGAVALIAAGASTVRTRR